MVDKRSWREFRESGMLWWINMILHTFGWSIVVDLEKDGRVINVYPARIKFRGFSEKNNTEGYEKVSQYLKDNIDDILKESKE